MPQDRGKGEGSGFAAYYSATADAPPRRTLLHAAAAFTRERQPFGEPIAIDLGCGTGRDSLLLLEHGWRVIAVDREPEALSVLGSRAQASGLSGRLTAVEADFSNLALSRCDLVNASFALPLCPPERFPSLWARIRAALDPAGRFAGQLYGPRDSWAGRPGITIHDRAAIDTLLACWTVELLDEEESDGVTPRGRPKHWHVWHVVARRAGTT
jgi:SAM-dependent methyltransferase